MYICQCDLPQKIVPGLNIFYRGHFQNTLNFKTFFGCAPENCQKECALNYDTYANEIENLKCILGHSTEIHSYSNISSESGNLQKMFTETCIKYMAGEISIGTLGYLTMIPEVQKENVHQIPKGLIS